jgi:hypothetical protein
MARGSAPAPVKLLTLYAGSEKLLAAVSATDPSVGFVLFRRPSGEWGCSCYSWQLHGSPCSHILAARARKERIPK